MRFCFDKAACQNTRRALQKEWLLTNGRGDYASSTILCCNTRKYHGLLTVNTIQGRYVLLSALEESVCGGGKEFFLSTRQHPRVLAPQGHQYLESFCQDQWPLFAYRVGDVRIVREMFLIRGQSRLILRWSIEGPARIPPLTLRVRPLLAFRHFHALTHANGQINGQTTPLEQGCSITPYAGLPTLHMQAQGEYTFTPEANWYRNVEYLQEQERGFDYSEDLYQPGCFELPLPALPAGGSVYMTVATEPLAAGSPSLSDIWAEESAARTSAHRKGGGLIGHLTQSGRQFCIETPTGRPAVLAGYHWFDAWGRDTLISLPGLTFLAGRTDFGLRVLTQVAQSIRNGLVPNCFAEDGHHAYNSADASLWYAFAVQSYLQTEPEDGLNWVRENAWPALKAIVSGYRQGPGMGIHVDANGLLHAGDAHTQLTWMDAQSRGEPVTPRHGCPVELNALWYNTLAFVDHLAARFAEPQWESGAGLRALRQSFFEHFWVARGGGYLGDVWRDGLLDQSVRPNQILAVSLPYPVLEDQHCPQVVECVRNQLLTPYGLRTLSPDDPAYRGRYSGGPEERDAAYHQGTVWPWLLGHYGDALLRAAWDVDGAVQALLDRLTPLFCDHLTDHGLGSISEIFDATPPHSPNGCIAQAWSVAECLRLLHRLKAAAPAVYSSWENLAAYRMAHPISGDTAGVCHVQMTLRPDPAQKP